MKYLALDQALKLSGFAVFIDNHLETWGTIETNPNYSIGARLSTIWQHLDILNNKYHFDHVFFEDVQKQVNQDTYKRLCYVQAVIMIWCHRNLKTYDILPPSHWRKIIKDKYHVNFGRKREEQKKAAQEWVKNNYSLGISNITEDECDAVCIGVAGYIEYNQNRSAF